MYTSNESQQDVLFDNLGITQTTGPVLEETHYYPFGLTMAEISTVAPLKLENRFKFQGQELQHKEFSDGSGLETYQFKYRMDDPQTGRFWQIDPLADKYVYNSPYAFSENKVTSYLELEGLESVYMDYRIERDLKDVESGKINAEQLNERLDVRAKSDILALGVGLTVDAAVEEFGLGTVVTAIRKFFKSQSNESATTKRESPNNPGGRTSNKLKPDENSTGDHTVFKTDKEGRVYKYETYQKTKTGHNDPVKRFDGGTEGGEPGVPHTNKQTKESVPTPHVQGKKIPGGVRPPKPDEIPNNNRFNQEPY